MRPTADVIFKLLKAQFLWWGQQLLLYMNCCRHSFSDEATHCCNICMSCCRHSFSDEANSCFQQAVQYEPYSHQLARIQEEEESSNRNSVEKVNHFDMPNLKGQYHEKNMVFYHKKCCFMHNKNYMIFKLSSFRCTGTTSLLIGLLFAWYFPSIMFSYPKQACQLSQLFTDSDD